jgi:hypothetical protein
MHMVAYVNVSEVCLKALQTGEWYTRSTELDLTGNMLLCQNIGNFFKYLKYLGVCLADQQFLLNDDPTSTYSSFIS